MAETTKLKLPKISDNMTADVVRDFNAMADAVDAKAGAAGGLATLGADGKVPAGQLAVDTSGLATKAELSAHNEDKASLTAYGHAKLSSATNSAAEDLAATPKAVKAAYDRAEQAFTQANDGKTAVANAVTAKGVAASPADTFATLASKIGQISTGVKWASGTSSGTTITVSGLDFNPKVIIAVANLDSTTQGRNVALYNRLFNDKIFSVYVDDQVITNYEMGTTTNSAYYSVFGGFRIGTRNSGTIRWIAFE